MSEHAAGESISSLARNYEPSATAIRNWKRQAKLKSSGAESSGNIDQQLRQLRRQNEQLRQKIAFLKKNMNLSASPRTDEINVRTLAKSDCGAQFLSQPRC